MFGWGLFLIVQRKAITSKGLGDFFVGEGDMNEAVPRHWMAEGLGCIQGEVIDAPVVDGDYYRLVIVDE